MYVPLHDENHVKIATSRVTSLFDDQRLTSVTNQVDYRTTVSYLPDRMGLDIKLFEKMDLSNQFYLDTGYCVTRHKTFNHKCLYDTFAEYTDLTAKEIKAELIKELTTNQDWYNKAGAACLGMRSVKYDMYVVEKIARSMRLA